MSKVNYISQVPTEDLEQAASANITAIRNGLGYIPKYLGAFIASQELSVNDNDLKNLLCVGTKMKLYAETIAYATDRADFIDAEANMNAFAIGFRAGKGTNTKAAFSQGYEKGYAEGLSQSKSKPLGENVDHSLVLYAVFSLMQEIYSQQTYDLEKYAAYEEMLHQAEHDNESPNIQLCTYNLKQLLDEMVKRKKDFDTLVAAYIALRGGSDEPDGTDQLYDVKNMADTYWDYESEETI